jgi:C4-dicarboxylate transporter DctM subunit
MTTLWIMVATGLTTVFFILGVPIFLCLATWTVIVSLAIHFTLGNIGQTCFSGISSFALLAMPLFVLTGDFIGAAGIATRLARFAYAFVGWLRGGLGMATLGASGIFAAISGSNSATTATIGSIMMPEMKRGGYPPAFSAATAAAGGCVGIIIPPSIIFIVYGFIMNLSIADLFMGGVIPGILMVLFMMAACFIVCHKRKWGEIVPLSPLNLVKSTWGARLGFIAIFVVLYGIYTGKFSPTEASGITAGYCFLAGIFLTRQIKLRETPSIVLRSGQISGLLGPIIAISVIMQQLLAIMGAKDVITNFITRLGGYYQMLFGMIGILLIAGCIMESLPVTIIFAPILAPIAQSIGVDPIHFGVIFLVAAAIGFITPPYGLNLFVASSISGVSYLRIARYVLPYFFANLAALLVTALYPPTAMWLVEKMRAAIGM